MQNLDRILISYKVTHTLIRMQEQVWGLFSDYTMLSAMHEELESVCYYVAKQLQELLVNAFKY